MLCQAAKYDGKIKLCINSNLSESSQTINMFILQKELKTKLQTNKHNVNWRSFNVSLNPSGTG